MDVVRALFILSPNLPQKLQRKTTELVSPPFMPLPYNHRYVPIKHQFGCGFSSWILFHVPILQLNALSCPFDRYCCFSSSVLHQPGQPADSCLSFNHVFTYPSKRPVSCC